MNMQDLSSLLIHLKAYQLDLDDRQRHAQQVNQEDKLTRNAINYLRARRNDAAQIISDIESEIAEATFPTEANSEQLTTTPRAARSPYQEIQQC